MLYEDEAAYLSGQDPLQVAEYDTSGSRPISLGDGLGGLTLTGYISKAGEKSLLRPFPADVPLEVTADMPLLVTYQVTNPGRLPLKNIEFSATGGNLPQWIGGDTNANGLLDPGEVWQYLALESAPMGHHQISVHLQAIATDPNGHLLGLPNLHTHGQLDYVGIASAPVGNLNDLFGEAQALTFQYLENDDVLTGGKGNHQYGKAKILVDAQADPDDLSFVIVTNEKDGIKALKKGKGDRFFEGEVGVNEFFQASNDLNAFSSNIYIHFYDDGNLADGIELLHSVGYSTSKVMQIGDQIGNATLVEYFGKSGAFDSPSITPVDAFV